MKPFKCNNKNCKDYKEINEDCGNCCKINYCEWNNCKDRI